MSYRIDEIEGIGPAYAQKLGAAGIRRTDELLQKGTDPKGRKGLAESTGISDKLILKWCNMADLMRISGVGEEYSELLEAAGVDTVKELKMRRADNLTAKMCEINDARTLVRQVPSQSQVEKWIAQAKDLPPALIY